MKEAKPKTYEVPNRIKTYKAVTGIQIPIYKEKRTSDMKRHVLIEG